MPREKPMYRENLETINKQFPDKEALSYKEIAAIMNISEDQVKINIFRARQAIRQKYFETEKYGL